MGDLKLEEGDSLLEIGTGSGYGAALAREIVGEEGKVVTIEIDPTTCRFGKENPRKAGYDDVLVMEGNGSKGFPEGSPYDRICLPPPQAFPNLSKSSWQPRVE